MYAVGVVQEVERLSSVEVGEGEVDLSRAPSLSNFSALQGAVTRFLGYPKSKGSININLSLYKCPQHLCSFYHALTLSRLF